VNAEKHGAIAGDELGFSHDLHRGLKARHITKTAIGSAIGTGGTNVFCRIRILGSFFFTGMLVLRQSWPHCSVTF